MSSRSELHPYCIRRAGEPPPAADLAGVDGAGVELLEDEGLGIWFSPAARRQPTVEDLRAHDLVVRHALRSATPLPFRFGAPVAGETALRELLRSRTDEFLASLERVAGRVEMGVRVDWDAEGQRRQVGAAPRPAPGDFVGSGREYLATRKRLLDAEHALRRHAEERLQAVDEVLQEELLRRGREPVSVCSALPRGGSAGTLAHLVHRHYIGSFRDLVVHTGERFPDLSLVVSGPWPPYSFV